MAGFTIGDGTVQRSRILSLGVTFSEVVTTVGATAAAFKLTGPGGSTIPLNVTLPTVSGHTEASITFNAGTEFGSLLDGNYTLQVMAGQIRDAANNTLQATASTNFHRRFGDSNGDDTVDFLTDFIAFRNVYNFPSEVFDFDNSGTVDFLSDFIQFRNRFTSV